MWLLLDWGRLRGALRQVRELKGQRVTTIMELKMALLTVAQFGCGGGDFWLTMDAVMEVGRMLHHAVLVFLHRWVHAAIHGRRFVRLL